MEPRSGIILQIVIHHPPTRPIVLVFFLEICAVSPPQYEYFNTFSYAAWTSNHIFMWVVPPHIMNIWTHFYVRCPHPLVWTSEHICMCCIPFPSMNISTHFSAVLIEEFTILQYIQLNRLFDFVCILVQLVSSSVALPSKLVKILLQVHQS